MTDSGPWFPRGDGGPVWGCGATGSAREWHSRGHGFDPRQLHRTGRRPLAGGSEFPGSAWGLAASADFKSVDPGLIPGMVGSIPTRFRLEHRAGRGRGRILQDRAGGPGGRRVRPPPRPARRFAPQIGFRPGGPGPGPNSAGSRGWTRREASAAPAPPRSALRASDRNLRCAPGCDRRHDLSRRGRTDPPSPNLSPLCRRVLPARPAGAPITFPSAREGAISNMLGQTAGSTTGAQCSRGRRPRRTESGPVPRRLAAMRRLVKKRRLDRHYRNSRYIVEGPARTPRRLGRSRR